MNAREDRSHMGNKKDMGTEEEEIVKRMEGQALTITTMSSHAQLQWMCALFFFPQESELNFERLDFEE